MILHRLRLTNFRGVADREIAFPERGVVVVCGPNEIGKSSMLEALDLLLTYRDRSTHRDVKAVKPANADVGAQVEAEISTGPYRFVYRKRFHKKTMTELEVIEPRRENLGADEAHERVEAMLAETLDTKLWDAQRVLQSASTHAVDLSGCDALSRALDAAAGEAEAAPGGDDALLIDRVEAQFLRYFTATGRPTGVWKAARERLTAAEAEESRRRSAVEDVEARVNRHEALTAAVGDLEESAVRAAARLAAARTMSEGLEDLREQVRQARLRVQAVAAKSANSALALTQRRQLVAEVARRGETFAALQAARAEADTREADAARTAEAARAAAERSTTAVQDAQLRFDAARAAAEACVAREAADKLAVRIAGIDEADTHLAGIAAELEAITLDAAGLSALEAQCAAVQSADAQLRADAATVEFTAPADLVVAVDGRPRTLAAGESWSAPASARMVVEVPGVLTVCVDPGASATKLRADRDAAHALLERGLAAAGVPDIGAARALDARRRALAESRTVHAAKREGLCGGEDPAALRGQLAEFRTAAAAGALDPAAAAAELSGADTALRAARTAAETARQDAVAAAAAHTAASTEGAVVREQLRTAEAEFGAVGEQLATLRAAVGDDAVAAQAGADEAELSAAEAALSVLAVRLAAADPDAVDAELAAASAALDAAGTERDNAKTELHTLAVELSVIGSEGRQSLLDEAQAELERARAEHCRIRDRAQAAELLRSTMIRHRDNTRQRYVAPYRGELERLGRDVFGDTFEVDVDSELTIQTRTLDGCTVPFDSLSGGAREQLGILARLAGAALVAREDTVPVVIDDALGFADPERLDRMSRVLGTVGARGQVIVLTCTPGRYDGVAEAHVIELSA